MMPVGRASVQTRATDMTGIRTTQPIPHDDRRMFTRLPASGTVTGACLSTPPTPVTLELRDVSFGGVSGWSNVPLARGERLVLSFPPSGRTPGRNAAGKVVRAEPTATGYAVAVEFDLAFA